MSSKVQCGDNLVATNTYGKVSVSSIELDRPAGEMWDDFHIPDDWEVESIYVGEDITAISGFSNSDVSEVHLPDKLEKIHDETFAGCLNLEEIDIPNGVTSIGDRAFMETGLAEVTIPKSVDTIGNQAFASCDNLRDVEIHAKNIGDSAFHNSNIAHLNIGNEVRNIGDEAFSDIKLGKNEKIMMTGVANVGENSFYGTKAEIITNDNIAAVLKEENINARIPNLREQAEDARNSLITDINDSSFSPVRDEISL